MSAPDVSAELLKTLRTGSVSRADLAAAAGLQLKTVEKWIRTWEAHGLVLCCTERSHRGAPKRYTLSPAWIGGSQPVSPDAQV